LIGRASRQASGGVDVAPCTCRTPAARLYRERGLSTLCTNLALLSLHVCRKPLRTGNLLSLHVWRKTLRGGMPVVIPPQQCPPQLKGPENLGIETSTLLLSSGPRLFADEFLRGWQYDNLPLACTAAPSWTASDAPENWCTYLRVCQVV
jgi:hypothetical protein